MTSNAIKENFVHSGPSSQKCTENDLQNLRDNSESCDSTENEIINIELIGNAKDFVQCIRKQKKVGQKRVLRNRSKTVRDLKKAKLKINYLNTTNQKLKRSVWMLSKKLRGFKIKFLFHLNQK